MDRKQWKNMGCCGSVAIQYLTTEVVNKGKYLILGN